MRRQYSKITGHHSYSIHELALCSTSRIVINISGEIYETRLGTLIRFPHTLLGDHKKRMAYYDFSRRELFFERSRLCFSAVLFFYQSGGILRCPEDVPYQVFVEECRFFELPEDAIKCVQEQQYRCLEGEDIPEGAIKQEALRNPPLRSIVWDILQNPQTSKVASLFSSFSLLAVVLSVMSSCLQSIPALRVQTQVFEENPWSIVELVLNTFFLIELLASMLCAPDLSKFIRSTMTAIDIIAILPYFIVLMVDKDKLNTFKFIRIFRLVRIGRMFRFSKKSQRIALVGKILMSCLSDFLTLLLCTCMIVVLVGSLMYYLEDMGNNGAGFHTIPMGMYWAIQTLFTIGYGDIVPFTPGGKVVGAAFMLFGASSICIPLLSIIAKFQAEWDPNANDEDEE